MKQKLVALVLCIAALELVSCQSATKSSAALGSRQAGTSDSQLEISYFLGHDSHRILAHRERNEVTAQAFVNQEMLKESKVDPARYEELLTQITGFVKSPKRKPSAQNSDDDCRGPFTVTLRQGKETRTLRGCRSNDDGTEFSRITRDAEFLLYSKK